MSQHQAKPGPIASRPKKERRRAAFLRDHLSPRLRDLFLDLLSRRCPGPHGTFVEVQALRVAELTVRAEDLRAKLGKEPSPH